MLSAAVVGDDLPGGAAAFEDEGGEVVAPEERDRAYGGAANLYNLVCLDVA